MLPPDNHSSPRLLESSHRLAAHATLSMASDTSPEAYSAPTVGAPSQPPPCPSLRTARSPDSGLQAMRNKGQRPTPCQTPAPPSSGGSGQGAQDNRHRALMQLSG